MAFHPGSHSSQSTDVENSRPAPKVVDRSDPVKTTKLGASLQDNKLDTDNSSSRLDGIARIQSIGGSGL